MPTMFRRAAAPVGGIALPILEPGRCPQPEVHRASNHPTSRACPGHTTDLGQTSRSESGEVSSGLFNNHARARATFRHARLRLPSPVQRSGIGREVGGEGRFKGYQLDA